MKNEVARILKEEDIFGTTKLLMIINRAFYGFI